MKIVIFHDKRIYSLYNREHRDENSILFSSFDEYFLLDMFLSISYMFSYDVAMSKQHYFVSHRLYHVVFSDLRSS